MKLEPNRVDQVVKSIFREFCDHDDPSFTEALSYQGCDSLDVIELAIAIEEDLEIPELEDEFVEKMGDLSIEQLIKAIQAKYPL